MAKKENKERAETASGLLKTMEEYQAAFAYTKYSKGSPEEKQDATGALYHLYDSLFKEDKKDHVLNHTLMVLSNEGAQKFIKDIYASEYLNAESQLTVGELFSRYRSGIEEIAKGDTAVWDKIVEKRGSDTVGSLRKKIESANYKKENPDEKEAEKGDEELGKYGDVINLLNVIEKARSIEVRNNCAKSFIKFQTQLQVEKAKEEKEDDKGKKKK